MAYNFIDGYGSVLTADSSIVSGSGVTGTQRPTITIMGVGATEAIAQGVSSTVNTNRSSLIGLSGAGLRNYLTDILIANTGSVATLVSFSDSNGSVIGKSIAPATSGSNVHLATPMRTGSLNSQIEFSAATAVSVLHVSGYGYRAP